MYQIGKRQTSMEYIKFWFKKIPSISRQTGYQMNRCFEETDIPEWMTKEKTTLIQKDTQKKNCLQKLETKNVPTDVASTNSSN